MGSSKESANVLSHLSENGRNIVAVVTQPDKRKGRGLKTSKNAVSEIAEKYEIPLIKPDKLDDNSIERILSFAPDLIIVVAYGKILPKKLLEGPKYGSVNLHASILPCYRGASPIQSAILSGDSETGITVMKMNEKLDEGDIIFQEKVSIEPTDDFLALSEKIFSAGRHLLDKTIKFLEDGTDLPAKKQDNLTATYCRTIKKNDGLVDLNSRAEEICNKVRAFSPWPGAYWMFRGKRIKILSAKPHADTFGPAEPGTAVGHIKNEGLAVRAKNGVILIKEVQPENSKKMSAEEFMNGYRIKIGEKIF